MAAIPAYERDYPFDRLGRLDCTLRHMSTFFEYLWALGQNWWWFMTSGPYLVEALVKQLWSGYETWANNYTKPETRRRASTWLVLFGVFVAGFIAFNEEHIKLRDIQIQLQQRNQFAAIQNTLTGQQNRQVKIVQQIGKFHGEALDLILVQIKKDRYSLWKDRGEKIIINISSWIEANLGPIAKNRLLDTNVFIGSDYSYVVNPDQRDRLILLALVGFRGGEVGAGLRGV